MTRAARALVPLAAALTLACGRHTNPETLKPEAPHALPLPTAGIAGQDVAVYPLTLLSAAEQLHWDTVLPPRRRALDKADSILGALLTERSPEIIWVLPSRLRRDAGQAPGMLVNPDQMATALLRSSTLTHLPDPLWSQMRNLNAVAGARYAFVPAALLYLAPGNGKARVELSLVLADVRSGEIGWRTVATAEDADPWIALRLAVKSLVPGLP